MILATQWVFTALLVASAIGYLWVARYLWDAVHRVVLVLFGAWWVAYLTFVIWLFWTVELR